MHVLPDADRARLTDDEVRWRHVQHLLTACTDQCDGRAPRPVLSELTEDLLDAGTGYPDALDAVRAAFYIDPADVTAARAMTVQYMLDPVALPTSGLGVLCVVLPCRYVDRLPYHSVD